MAELILLGLTTYLELQVALFILFFVDCIITVVGNLDTILLIKIDP